MSGFQTLRHEQPVTWYYIWRCIKAKFQGQVIAFEISISPVGSVDLPGFLYTGHAILPPVKTVDECEED